MIAHLKERGILSVFHYLPLHLSDMGRKFGGKEGDCPVTESLSERVLVLPAGAGVGAAEAGAVCELLRFALKNADAIRARLAAARGA